MQSEICNGLQMIRVDPFIRPNSRYMSTNQISFPFWWNPWMKNRKTVKTLTDITFYPLATGCGWSISGTSIYNAGYSNYSRLFLCSFQDVLETEHFISIFVTPIRTRMPCKWHWFPSAKLSRQETPNSVKTKCNESDIHSIRQSHITFHHITTTTTRTICRFGKLCGPKVSLPRTWLFLTCFWPLYVSSMCEHSMCEHPMCEHSMCEHSM